MDEELIIGIDLGTTHSLVGVVDSGFPIVLADEKGDLGHDFGKRCGSHRGRRRSEPVVNRPTVTADEVVPHVAVRPHPTTLEHARGRDSSV